MSYPKNIKRNNTRPTASKRPYVQSMYGKRPTESQEREMRLKTQLEAKLKSWNEL